MVLGSVDLVQYRVQIPETMDTASLHPSTTGACAATSYDVVMSSDYDEDELLPVSDKLLPNGKPLSRGAFSCRAGAAALLAALGGLASLLVCGVVARGDFLRGGGVQPLHGEKSSVQPVLRNGGCLPQEVQNRLPEALHEKFHRGGLKVVRNIFDTLKNGGK